MLLRLKYKRGNVKFKVNLISNVYPQNFEYVHEKNKCSKDSSFKKIAGFNVRFKPAFKL